MAKAKNSEGKTERDMISDYIDSLKLKDLKRAAIMRGCPFRRATESSVYQLQSWVFLNYHTHINPLLLESYDKWRDQELMDEGVINGPLHIDLKMGLYATDDQGNEKRERRNPMLMGATKTQEEVAAFIPKKGSMKALTFQLMRDGLKTKEVIEQVQAAFSYAGEASIKVWCSKARKAIKAQKELDDDF